MAGLNTEFGGGLSHKELSAEAARTASDMERVIADFTEGMSDAAAARYRGLLGRYSEFEHLKTKIAEKSNISRMEQELSNFKGTVKQREKLEQELQAEKERVGVNTLRALASLQEHQYKTASATTKARMKREQSEAIANARVTAKEKYEQEWAAAQGDAVKRKQLTDDYRAYVVNSIKDEQDARMASIKLQQSAVAKNLKHTNKDMNALLKHPNLKNIGKFSLDLAVLGGKDLSKVIDGLKGVHQAANEELEQRKEELEALKEAGIDEDSEEYQAALKAVTEAQNQKDIAAAMEAVADSVNKVKEAFNGAFKEVEDMMTTYMGKIDSRLQGSDTSYKEAMGKISTNLSVSPFVKSKATIDNMYKLVEQGIAYNLEQRAFLGTVSDKIASTFDAFDSNLARLIRLQQADTTAARLGMEAALTQFLNGMYQDTSYMSGAMDSVSSTLIDASSTMTRNMSAEFEYVVHKWMGSLSSVGLSDNTVNQIVTGINYLATGDVSSLASNAQLQTLLAMSSAKAGLEYSELLINGLDSSSTNKLLSAMVTYLKEIAEGSDNQVVRAAYGDVFNLSMSDMKAISNLRASDISNITSNMLSYSGMEQELTSQFSKLITRTSISEMMNNLYENAIFGVAEDLVSNPVTYSMYKMLGFLKERDLDINIPFINAMGFGVDLNTSVQGLMNLGIGLSSALSLVSNIVGGLGSGGGLNLGAWGGAEYTQRGNGAAFSTAGAAGATSGSTYVASGSATDMQNSTLNSATDDAEETKKITNKNSDPGKTIDDLYKASVDEAGKFLRTTDLSILEALRDDGKNFIHTRDSRLNFDEGALLTRDDKLYKAFTDVFGTASLISRGAVNVNSSSALDAFDFITDYKASIELQRTATTDDNIDGSNLAVLQVYDSHAVEAIKSIGSLSGGIKVESFGKDATATLTTAIAHEIRGGKTVGELYKLFSDANGSDKAHVRVQNEDGKRLQVDTEAIAINEDSYDLNAIKERDSRYSDLTSKGIVW